MKLSEVAFDSIAINDRVVSAAGMFGYVADKWSDANSAFEEAALLIKWNNGNHTFQRHCVLHQIEYKGPVVISFVEKSLFVRPHNGQFV